MQQEKIDIHVYTKDTPLPDNVTIANDFNILEMSKVLYKLVIFKKDIYTIDLVMHMPLSEKLFILRLEFHYVISRKRVLKYCRPLFDLLNSMNQKKKAQIH